MQPQCADKIEIQYCLNDNLIKSLTDLPLSLQLM